jgi:hypothetical protein
VIRVNAFVKVLRNMQIEWVQIEPHGLQEFWMIFMQLDCYIFVYLL